MNKQEAIEEIKNISTFKINDTVTHQQFYMVNKNNVLDIVSKIDEPKKVVVPQFVAEWYEDNKDGLEYNLYKLCIDFHENKLRADLYEWFNDGNNTCIETLVKMKLFGYEVEKEKLYTVELPNPNAGGNVVLCKTGDGRVSITFANAGRWRGVKNVQLTESEIKKDFEWAWQFAKEVEND